MAKKQHTSKHRVGAKLVKVPRRFDQAHIDAGYHEQEWGEHSHPEHDLIGQHGNVLVEHVEGPPEYGPREEDGALVLVDGAVTHGPEFKLTWPDGTSLTILCADVVRTYLDAEVEAA